MPCFRPFRVFCALNTHNHPRHEDEKKQRLGLVISPLDSQLTASVRSFFVLAATKAPLAILFQASSPLRSQSALIYFQSADLALHACMLIVSRYQPSPLLFLSPHTLSEPRTPTPWVKKARVGSSSSSSFRHLGASTSPTPLHPFSTPTTHVHF